MGIPLHSLLSVWVLFAYSFCPALFLCLFIRKKTRRAFLKHSSFGGIVWGKDDSSRLRDGWCRKQNKNGKAAFVWQAPERSLYA